jgi:hypothetical protein
VIGAWASQTQTKHPVKAIPGMRQKVSRGAVLLFVFSLIVLGGALYLVWASPDEHAHRAARAVLPR